VEGLRTWAHRTAHMARWGIVTLLLVALVAVVAPGAALAAVPTVTGVSPGSGSAAGGTSVTISGTGLTGATAVTFGGSDASSFTVDTDAQITATAPAGTAGTVAVAVTTADGTASLTDAFTYIAVPTVTSVDPNAGPTAGGQSVTITGDGFQSGATVSFGGAPATGVSFISATSLTAITPAGAAGAVDVAVTNPDTQTGSLPGGYTRVAPPTASGVTPTAGPTAGGTSVTITGTNFTGVTNVTFDGMDAIRFTAASDTQIIVTTPAHGAGSVDVVVTTPGGGTTLTGAFTFVAAPTIAGITPATGSTDADEPTQVTLTGTGFQAGATVAFGGAAATGVTVVDSTTLTALAPAHAAGTVDVVVRNPDGQSATLTGGFTYVQGGHGPPSHGGLSVRQIEPPAGSTAGGDQIVIKGTGFAAGATVTIGGAAASDVRVLNSTTIGATTPAHAAGTVDVTVASGGTSATLGGAYTYRDGQGRGDGGPPAGRGNGGNGGNGGPPPGQTPQGRHGQGGSQPAGSGNPGQQPGNAPTHR
jgi:hypothetical protein